MTEKLSSTAAKPDRGGISRRTVVSTAAWAAPAIVASAGSPAFAASSNFSLVFDSVPQYTPASGATTTDLILGSVGTSDPVQVTFALENGFRFASGGTDAIFTSVGGIVTIPAGAIIAGNTDGIITATAVWNNITATAAAALSITATAGAGVLTWNSGSSSYPLTAASGTIDNSGFIRLYPSANGQNAVAVKQNGDVYTVSHQGSGKATWTTYGTGAATDPNQVAATEKGGVSGVYTIANGVLTWNSGSSSYPLTAASGTIDNSGFIRLYPSANGQNAVAVKQNGDLYTVSHQGSGKATWTTYGTGAATDPNQVAATEKGGVSGVYTIANGVLTWNSGSSSYPLTAASGTIDNSGFIRLYPSANGQNAVAVKQNGDLYTVSHQGSGKATWTTYGTGAATDPNQVAATEKGGVSGVYTIANGVLTWNSGSSSYPLTAASGTIDNSGFIRLYPSANGQNAVAVKQNGDLYTVSHQGSGKATWTTYGTGAATDPNQVAATEKGGVSGVYTIAAAA